MTNLTNKISAGFFTATAAVLGFGTQALAAASEDLKTSAANQMNTTAGAIYGTGTATATPLPVLIGNVINVVLGLLGVILVLLVIFAGFLWMTAQGDADKVKKAKAMLTNAVIGMVLIFAAYSISAFVIDKLVSATI
jgi:hypothetical protein